VHKQDSNVLGDRDIWGDDARFHIGGTAADDVEVDAVRRYWLFVRVRFRFDVAAAQQGVAAVGPGGYAPGDRS